MKRKVLFIVNHRRGRSPGQRFRFEQYLEYLEENGFECQLSNIVTEEEDQILYSKGNYLKKGLLAKNAYLRRTKDTKMAHHYDIIFIFREAYLTGSTRFEKAFAASGAKIIYDFDDAIWLPNVSKENKRLQKLKNPLKTQEIIAYADMVFAGNAYLAAYAREFCDNVKVLPTTIDTDYHKRKEKATEDRLCIGWTGTQTTLRYLEELKGVFKSLKEKYGEKVYFKVICDTPWEVEELDIKNEKWSKEREIEQLEEIAIGVMPLSDDEWSRGKCGFKGLQYMAMEIPAVLSPVGVNKEIIEDGKNGFLANDEESWFRILSLLIESHELRENLGKEGRKTIIERYSVSAWKEKYVEYFNEVLK
jgi:glycosyltransferase involved in cell wall biosynthesis